MHGCRGNGPARVLSGVRRVPLPASLQPGGDRGARPDPPAGRRHQLWQRRRASPAPRDGEGSAGRPSGAACGGECSASGAVVRGVRRLTRPLRAPAGLEPSMRSCGRRAPRRGTCSARSGETRARSGAGGAELEADPIARGAGGPSQQPSPRRSAQPEQLHGRRPRELPGLRSRPPADPPAPGRGVHGDRRPPPPGASPGRALSCGSVYRSSSNFPRKQLYFY